MSSRPVPYFFQRHEASNRLVVAFTGHDKRQRVGMRRFNFYGTVQALSAHRLYLRDEQHLWYAAGIPGLGSTLHAVRDFVQATADSVRASHMVLLGNSAGAYAALALGALVQAPHVTVHAFAPQTRLLTPQDEINKGQIQRLHRLIDPTAPYLDLSVLYRETTDAVRAHVYYAPESARDVCHAERLRPFPSVRLVRLPRGGHQVAAILMAAGSLPAILRRSMQDPTYDPSRDAQRRYLLGYVRFHLRRGTLQKKLRARLGLER